MPDWWNNATAIQRINAPILIVHSDADSVNPLEDGQKIFAAANGSKRMIVVHGFQHNAVYQEPSEAWWGNVLAFISEQHSLRR
jgi:alpha-beta hydrolase superfamily lysophospholipase